MLGPPNLVCVFEIKYTDGKSKTVKIFDWNRGGAWGHICRYLGRGDYGDTNKVESLNCISQSEMIY